MGGKRRQLPTHFPSFPSSDDKDTLLDYVRLPGRLLGAVAIRGAERLSRLQLAAIVDAYHVIELEEIRSKHGVASTLIEALEAVDKLAEHTICEDDSDILGTLADMRQHVSAAFKSVGHPLKKEQ